MAHGRAEYGCGVLSEGRVEAGGIAFGVVQAGDGAARALPARVPRLGSHVAAPAARARGRGLPCGGAVHARVRADCLPADGQYGIGALSADAIALHETLGGDEDAVLIGHDWGAEAAYAGRHSRAAPLAPPSRRIGRAPAGRSRRRLFARSWHSASASAYPFLLKTPDAAGRRGRGRHGVHRPSCGATGRPGTTLTEDLRTPWPRPGAPGHLVAAIGDDRALARPWPPPAAHRPRRRTWWSTPTRPTLYLHGDRRRLPLDRRLVATPVTICPRPSAAHLVEGAGHFLHLERPAAVNSRIVEWASG